jgi:hypothetical protein
MSLSGNLAGNIAPVIGGILICAIAYVSVRRAHRKGREPAPAPESRPAE